MKPTVIDPKTTTRAEAYDLWMSAPNPMVTSSTAANAAENSAPTGWRQTTTP